ncbi:thioesterase [Veronia nyctiphanis]|uniref:Thioesterase n=1 Tax=Veronia nyctiphanis TaxID=1278244 RepID=A0A4V1LT22_9GAMM|nr:thioesterase family protein [Veronia nyctiphanis]RXJ73688.1 thioesterase [Veronia nyctiphanis]
MIDALKDYPVITEISVAWGEMDALNHVNNAVYLRYFETARLEYFSRFSMMEDIPKTKKGPVLGEVTCKYIRPVTYPDTLLIGSRVTNIGEDRFDMEYLAYSKAQGAVTTKGTAKTVMFDFANQCKTTLPSHIREAMEAIEAK